MDRWTDGLVDGPDGPDGPKTNKSLLTRTDNGEI